MALLMTWKPDHWPHARLMQVIEKFQREGSVVEPWRISAHRQAKVGDRVWLLRQGKEKRGIFAIGEVAALPSIHDYQGEERMMAPIRFSRMVDPERRLLLPLGEIQNILEPTQINTQSSGITITEAQSAALEALLPLETDENKGTDWTPEELAAIVPDYFAMLADEITGRAYSKAAHRDALRRIIRRTDGSIEHTHQNISSVLHKLGFRWIDGYKPLGNAQTALTDEIGKRLADLQPLLDQVTQPLPVSEVDASAIFVEPPVEGREPKETTSLKFLAKKFDVAARDKRNRELGRAGEELVLAIEQRRLRSLGMDDEAEKVRWVSRDEGDGLGYDIVSFAEDGSAIYIEVKTTRAGIAAPFYVSERERMVAADKGEAYRLYRVFQFGSEPLIYAVVGAMENGLNLKPVNYRASVRKRDP